MEIEYCQIWSVALATARKDSRNLAIGAKYHYIARIRDFACLATCPSGAFSKKTPNPDSAPPKWLGGV
jgi:hypothetical protein